MGRGCLRNRSFRKGLLRKGSRAVGSVVVVREVIGESSCWSGSGWLNWFWEEYARHDGRATAEKLGVCQANTILISLFVRCVRVPAHAARPEGIYLRARDLTNLRPLALTDPQRNPPRNPLCWGQNGRGGSPVVDPGISNRSAMLLKLQRPLLFFDLETTGLDTENDRVVEVGLVKLLPDGQRERMVERVDPGVDIPESAANIHGIHTQDVRGLFGKPRLDVVAPGLLEFIGDADLAGFNSIAYDLPLWMAECRRHGIPFSPDGRHHVDVKIIFHEKETGWDRFLMGPRNLAAAVRHYCGRELVGAHSADHDAEGTLDVLLAQLERHPDIPKDVEGLAHLCAELEQLAR